MVSAPEIAIATSIPPKMTRLVGGQDIGEQYQADCISSWIDAGFKVFSVNAPDEIPLLAARYPLVEFVPTDRDSGAVAGRKTPLIDDLLLVLARQDRPIVGIVNADICLETGRDWVSPITEAIPSSLLISHRLDVESWPGQPGAVTVSGAPNPYGFDLFFFEKTAILDCLAKDGAKRFYSMGMPWWDFWFPIAMAFSGYRVAPLEDPVAAHLLHPTNYDQAIWEYMAAQLIDFVLQHGADGVGGRIPELMPMIEWAQKLGPRASHEIEHWTRQREVSDRGEAWCGQYKVELALFSRVVLGTVDAGIGGNRNRSRLDPVSAVRLSPARLD
jgi:hypothetical protein